MNALLEIGVEHLPARFMAPALSQLEKLAADLLAEKRISYDSIHAFGTYRRLVVEIVNIADKSADVQKEVKGPPAKLLKDATGNFTPQSAGFAQKNGIAPEKLTVVETDKGPFIYAKIKIKGEKTAKLLPEIFTRLVTGLEFAYVEDHVDLAGTVHESFLSLEDLGLSGAGPEREAYNRGHLHVGVLQRVIASGNVAGVDAN